MVAICLSFPVFPTAHITPRLVSNYEGHPVVLDCEGAVNREKATAQLVLGGYITVDWLGPDGHPLEGTNIILGDDIATDSMISQSLMIPDVQVAHSGVYTCQVTLHLLNNISHSVTSRHHLVLLSKCIHCIIYLSWKVED